MKPTTRTLWGPGGALPALCGGGAVLAAGAIAWPFTVDDAFIAARYAEHIAGGHGYTYNVGAPSDGVTGPLWLLPMVLAQLLGLAPMAVAKALGLGAMALTAALTGFRGGVAAASVMAVQGTLAIWGVAGLETGLATLLLACAADDLVSPDGRGVVSGLSLGALAWLRPEMAVPALAVLVLFFLRDRRSAARALTIAAAAALAVVGFRLALFGSVLPLSAFAKPPSLGHGLAYAGRALLVTTGLVGLVPVVWALVRGGAADRALAVIAGAHVAGVVLGGGDWMPGYRLMAPALPLYALLFARGLRLTPARRLLTVPVFALALAVPALDLAVALPDVRAAGLLREGPGEDLAREVSRHRTVALLDVGFVGYRSGVEIVDLGGLTDPAIGRAPGGHLDKRIDPGLLASREPDAIVVHTSAPPEVTSDGQLRTQPGYAVERRVASLPFVRTHFRVARVIPYADHYHYVVLERRAAQR